MQKDILVDKVYLLFTFLSLFPHQSVIVLEFIYIFYHPWLESIKKNSQCGPTYALYIQIMICFPYVYHSFLILIYIFPFAYVIWPWVRYKSLKTYLAVNVFFYYLLIKVQGMNMYTCKVIDYLVNMHWFGRNRLKIGPTSL